ncbi:MAG TPA: hypothetical protein VLE21_02835, partial [Candidatus Nitrosocosmicus sp.]|nr:hypothetical protein [Candidatus Nitrosocosmicus sp.]
MTIRANEPYLDFKDLVNLAVYTSDDIYLGKISSINKSHIEVKFYEIGPNAYRFTLDMIDRWIGTSVWLNIAYEESKQYIYNQTPELKTDTLIRTDYETVTFRLNENIIRAIRTEANNRELSL